MRRIDCFLVLLISAFLAACSSKPAAPSGPAKHYTVTGVVVTTNPKEQTASIDAQAIPDYMEAMKMDYPVRDKQEFDRLKPGEKITGTLDVFQSGDYVLHDIKPEPSALK